MANRHYRFIHPPSYATTHLFIALLVLSLSVSVLSQASAAPTQLFKINPTSEESYAESYTLVARLDNDDYLLLQAMVMNGGFGDEKPACRILYVPKGKNGINEVNREGAWLASKPEGKLRIGTCVLKETARGATWEAKTEKMSVKVYLKGQKGPSTTSTMNQQVGEKFFEHELIMPWSKVSVALSVRSQAPLQLKGRGTLNHTRSTALPPELSKKMTKVYLFDDDGGALLELKRKPSGQLTAWSWTSEAKSPRSLKPTSVGISNIGGGLRKGDEIKLSINGALYKVQQIKKIYTYEPIKAYGIAGRLLKKWVGDPLNVTSFIEVRGEKGAMKGFVEEITLR